MTRSETRRTISPPWYAAGIHFTCTQCGNCCSGPSGYVWFNEDELQAMADHLQVSREEFLQRYACRFEGQWSLDEVKTRQGYDCIFLERDEQGRAMCRVYPVRPTQCRTWPFWPENMRSPRAYRAAAKRCPGVAAGLEGKGERFTEQMIQVRIDVTRK
jgi:hypothetical protein